MKIFLLYCYDAARLCSDECCFTEMHLPVDHSK